MIGTTLGHYEILRKVGSGGMGDVYAARDTKLDREVALKILPPEVATDVERRKRFEREAKAAAKLSHPGIVTLHSVEEQGGEVFITMELVEGQPLAELTAKGPLDLDQMLDLARQIADAVATAHEHGITHRDLKPQNVVVTPDGVAKVLDFGLAKFTEEKADPATTHMATASVTTGDGRILGTPAYMSPEQAEGKPVDHRTDVFSLGVVFYEMATGRRPFEGDSAMSMCSRTRRRASASCGPSCRRGWRESSIAVW
ncbi:MAG: serine/threonine protein kinase [Deltaproteobacteria bacterium]|nr:serine/threonine protein kinase [Deltaproteobacteria bacterium]